MINRIAVATAFILLAVSSTANAADRMIAGTDEGVELIAAGATDTITAPGAIVTEIGEDIGNFGVGGLATGSFFGGVKGVGQAMMGGTRIIIGVLDVLTAPVRESSYNRNSPGSVR